jgi:hypothetical protein
MAELMLALIVILGLILAWIILLIGVKSKGLGKVILNEPFTVFFVVVGTILAIVLVLIPLIETGIANLVVDYYLDNPVKI